MERNLLHFRVWLKRRGIVLQTVALLFAASSAFTWPAYGAGNDHVPETLFFSFIDYTSHELAVNGRSTVDITMVEDIVALGEVVVVGYGSQRKTALFDLFQIKELNKL